MTLTPNHAFDATATPVVSDNSHPAAQNGRFVINLCRVAAPIPIPQPRSSQLMKYRFFLSERWEEGRRRYRLHMGYFPTVAAAQKWLGILRRVYPGAFVSEAPPDQLDLLSNTEVLRILQQPVVTARTREQQARLALKESLEALGASEFDIHDEDNLNSTDVRHLCVELQKDRPGRWWIKGAAARARKL